MTKLLENCDGRNHGQKKNKNKKQKIQKNTETKSRNEIQKPSAWYALGLKTLLSVSMAHSISIFVNFINNYIKGGWERDPQPGLQ